MAQNVYMVIKLCQGGFAWHCCSNESRPFASFFKSRAQAEVSKLNNDGYRASIVTVDINAATCFVDLNNL